MLYLVVWLPRIVGRVPNYSRWMSTSPLKAVIPLLVRWVLLALRPVPSPPPSLRGTKDSR